MNTQSYNIETLVAGPGVARANVRVSFGFPDLAGQAVSYDLTNTSAPCYVQEFTMGSGNNTYSKPPSAGGVIIMPPVDNTHALVLKGASGDTGTLLHLTAPSFIPLDQSVTFIILNAAATITGFKLIWV